MFLHLEDYETSDWDRINRNFANSGKLNPKSGWKGAFQMAINSSIHLMSKIHSDQGYSKYSN